jgi:hypothetical protein
MAWPERACYCFHPPLSTTEMAGKVFGKKQVITNYSRAKTRLDYRLQVLRQKRKWISRYGRPLSNRWPFCIDPLDGGTPALVTQLTANGGCATWSNLSTPGDYVVTEANANETNWFHSGGTSMIMLVRFLQQEVRLAWIGRSPPFIRSETRYMSLPILRP